MRILILNWRDIKNPSSGGAEILTHEIAKRWVRWGHVVTQFSSGFKNSLKEEKIDGVRIVRGGRWWNVHVFAFFYYLSIKKSIDVIIDEVHWFPFFSAVYARKKTLLLVCEVAGRLFYNLFPYPLAFMWRMFEKFYFVIYKNIPMVAISMSTKNDLIKEGFKENNIAVLPMGLNLPKDLKIYPKERKSTIVYLGRLIAQKGIEDTIVSFSIIKKHIPDSELWILGSGKASYIKKIRKNISRLSLTKSVFFFGFVSEEDKFKLLSKAHILISPSIHEGWGLTVPEAGAVGTVSVVYNSAGLRDLIVNGKNGLICKQNTPIDLAKNIIMLLKNKDLYSKLRKNMIGDVKKYSWDDCARTVLDRANNL